VSAHSPGSLLFTDFLLSCSFLSSDYGHFCILPVYYGCASLRFLMNFYSRVPQKKKKNKKQKNKKGGKEKESFCMRNEKMAQDGKQEEHGPNDFLEGINVL